MFSMLKENYLRTAMAIFRFNIVITFHVCTDVRESRTLCSISSTIWGRGVDVAAAVLPEDGVVLGHPLSSWRVQEWKSVLVWSGHSCNCNCVRGEENKTIYEGKLNYRFDLDDLLKAAWRWRGGGYHGPLGVDLPILSLGLPAPPGQGEVGKIFTTSPRIVKLFKHAWIVIYIRLNWISADVFYRLDCNILFSNTKL